MREIDVSIVIVTYNTEQITYQCVQSVLKSETDYTYEIIVIDNNSSDQTATRLNADFPQIKVIESDKNLGFSKGNNVGIAASIGKYVLLLNSDTILFENSLQNLLKTAISKGYQITGPVLLNADHSIQRSWFNFPSALKIFLRLTDFYLLFYKLSKSVLFKLIYGWRKPAFMITEINEDVQMDYLTFACILLKRDVIEQIGNLDEDLFFYQEDCEYGLRAAKHNYRFMYCVSAKVIHLGGTSSGQFSWLAFENDILGLLHIYKKHYSAQKFKLINWVISAALQIRIMLSYFGFYNHFKKSGLYNKEVSKANAQEQITDKYVKLKKAVKNYN